MLYRQRQILILIFGGLIFLLNIQTLRSQDTPSDVISRTLIGGGEFITGAPGIQVSVIQGLSFGNFCTGINGGTVTVPGNGSRSATGGITLLPVGPGSPAIFRLVPYHKNTSVVTMMVGNIVNLSNGAGSTLTLTINSFYPMYPIALIVGNNDIRVGGTLTVGPKTTTPPGDYAGSFEVIFNTQ